MSFEPILLAPEAEMAPAYPYRRVWRTGWQEAILLFFAVLILWALRTFFDLAAFNRQDTVSKLGIALLPLAAWLAISYRAERRALQPRPRMLTVLLLGALVANAIAVPLEEHLFAPDQWLPTVGFFARVLGYTTTLGITAAFLIYFVLRFSVWPQHIARRQDSVAYSLTAALGYAMVLSLRFALSSEATLVATGLRVASLVYVHLAMGAIVGFFMGELILARVSILWLPIGLSLSALVGGLHYGFRAIAILGGLSLEGTGSNPVRGLLLAFGFLSIVYLSLAFVIHSADVRQAYAAGRREPIL